MSPKRYLLILWAILPGTSGEDSVTQGPPEMTAEERQTVPLSCSYSTSHTAYLWYLQHLGEPPKYLLKMFSSGEVVPSHDCPDRMSGSLEKKSQRFHLTISGALVEDSAMYFCAVRPTLFLGDDGSAQKLDLRMRKVPCSAAI